jgi:hypothetical protein
LQQIGSAYDVTRPYEAVREALQAASSNAPSLPEYLRWTDLDDEALRAAPEDVYGHPSLRVHRSFLLIRTGFGKYDYSELKVILTPDKSMHLQVLYAYLGDLGLEFDRDSLISGGTLVFEYDPGTHKLAKASLARSSITSLRASGHASSLTDREAEAIEAQLNQLTSKSRFVWPGSR